jgi:hypothetical protein
LQPSTENFQKLLSIAGNKAESEEGFKCMGVICNDRPSDDTMET